MTSADQIRTDPRFYVFFFGLAFDYKGIEAGGEGAQLVMFVITIVAALMIIATCPAPHRRSHITPTALLLHLMLISSLCVALLRDIEMDRYIRVAAPIYLLVLGYHVGVRLPAALGHHRALQLILASACTSLIFTFFYGLAASEIELQDIRFQILSPALFIALPMAVHDFLIVRRQRSLSLTIIAACFFMTVLGATRSWLIAWVIVVLSGIAFWRLRRGEGLPTALLRSSGIFTALSLVLIVATFALAPDALTRLIERTLFFQEIGFDVTSFTRIAEINYQLEAWASDWSTVIFGNGLGASYGFSGDETLSLAAVLGNEFATVDWWFAGHNFWVYSLFTQGLLAGWILPFVILNLAYASIRQLMQRRRSPKPARMDDSLAELLALIAISVAACTIGGNPIGSRMLALFIGIFIGFGEQLGRRLTLRHERPA